MLYNFKKIQVVPSHTEFVDVILSKTQRQTPTVVHPGYKITRIRQFYMRKVKYTQQNFRERLNIIIDEFPKLDDIHPFYADLINVLYDRDHYKLALGQISTARTLIDTIGKDYLRLMKYADSLYRCKQLKKAALGRMCTLMKRLNSSLSYLEQVRQHLGRLPSIDPNTRTLIVCGYPNVGKSSFMNKVTRADVEVQPYAFTTKSLFVGHMDYQYLRWQVIDTPGVLDHPLEDRNTIEMQAITALAHLRAAVLYFLDPSEQCGYTLLEQINLFESIKPLFANKPLVLVLNKIDIVRREDLSSNYQEMLQRLEASENVELISMSNASEEGVMNVKNTACERLLAQRVETKLKSKKAHDVLNKLHLATPKKRDNKVREVSIPQAVLDKREDVMDTDEPRKLEKDIEAENGGPGLYSVEWRKNYKLKNDEWKFDTIPEIMDGMNVADFFDADIEAKLAALEEEEEQRLAELEQQKQFQMSDDDELDSDDAELLAEVREKKGLMVAKHRQDKNRNSARPERNRRAAKLSELEAHLDDVGMEVEPAVERARSRSRVREAARKEQNERGRKRQRELEESRPPTASRVRSASRPLEKGDGFRNVKQKVEAETLAKKSSKVRNRNAKKGEGDRVILNMMPKHLYTGKRGNGKTDRR